MPKRKKVEDLDGMQKSCGVPDARLLVKAIHEAGISIENVAYYQGCDSIGIQGLTTNSRIKLQEGLATCQERSNTGRVFVVTEPDESGVAIIPLRKFASNYIFTEPQIYDLDLATTPPLNLLTNLY